MSKAIRTYEDLMLEKKNLEALLAAQRELIRCDLLEIKESLKPATNAVSFVSRLVTRDHHNPLLGTAANSIIDLLVKRVLLARAGWIKRLIIPFAIKNISSHFIAKHKGEIMDKLFPVVRRNGGYREASDVPDLSKN